MARLYINSFLLPSPRRGLCITHIFLKPCAIASRSGWTERSCAVQVSTVWGFGMRSRFGME
ncbi:MAG: hypothetical protein RH949_11565 [Coleofasciculus sp. A1-SPW-01]|uniref:hypothetical protein n=1 Tax=Coleofasciculus TaxID=669368 RepID=UPI0009FC7417|nr:hypothetical protein [Coleofasciculus chthonoplastes]